MVGNAVWRCLSVGFVGGGRLDAAAALAAALAAADGGRLDEARKLLEDAVRRVEGCGAGQDAFGRALVADLQVTRARKHCQNTPLLARSHLH